MKTVFQIFPQIIRALVAVSLVFVAHAKADDALLSDQLAGLETYVACLDKAAPEQYGGPRFELLRPLEALAVCRKALDTVPDELRAEVFLYAGRAYDAAGQHEVAYWLLSRAVDDGLPAAYGQLAYHLYDSEADDKRALALAQKGHEGGDWVATNVIASLYAQDRIEGKSIDDALVLAKQGAINGSSLSQFLYAWLLEIKGNQPINAAIWYQKAHKAGEIRATGFWAELLERGIGDADPEPERAVELYWQALKAGDSWTLEAFLKKGRDRSKEVITGIQTKLIDAGLLKGKADGKVGKRTLTAIRKIAGL